MVVARPGAGCLIPRRCGLDGKVRLWDVTTGRQRATLSDNYVDSVEDLAFSPDGRLIAGNDSKHRAVRLWKNLYR
ncbi:WD40 repeat domain-containing protein [Streptomyces sp. LZ34]